MDRFFKYKLDHVIFWVLTIFFHGYTRLWIFDKLGAVQFLVEVLLRNGLLAIVLYFALLVIIPRFTSGKKTGITLLLLLASLAFYVLLKNAHDFYLFVYVIGVPEKADFLQNTLYNSSIVLFYLAFASALHLSKQWALQRELIRKIEVEKLNTELEYLKAQINPHFLFNSINTIYFQINKQNTSARETLAKFSEMLRYQLYECNGHEISIEKEVSYVKNYVELQRLRKDENYSIELSCADGLANFTLPPLLLIPFIENAFKYVSHFTDKKNVIKIELSKTNTFFHFMVFNSKDNSQPHAVNGGIGLKNVQRRLELLFKDKYLLDIVDSSENFKIRLDLKVEQRL